MKSYRHEFSPKTSSTFNLDQQNNFEYAIDPKIRASLRICNPDAYEFHQSAHDNFNSAHGKSHYSLKPLFYSSRMI